MKRKLLLMLVIVLTCINACQQVWWAFFSDLPYNAFPCLTWFVVVQCGIYCLWDCSRNINKPYEK